ncbi:SGNH/GDSL hydrolase family protein [Aquabacter spiritensis]|uniref:GDSL-like lipase/acylhydrolase family protein n=1 Tax=Aquabacter spiritensis TaxID=933073 RepID=A0A4R3LZS7_9HYPH|nr:SGNH/GDSL hydrolase family protein [Aquabacter spiritensis]TCT04305.1 GDSL-like lipase/acylhydrolase family protein [Aquabacter spiritensis]
MRRVWLLGGGALLLLIFGTEMVLRLGLGLGDPPLSVRDPKVDYLLKPSQTYQRFGMVYSVNAYGMRARDPSPTKEPCEFRVLVVGDSVLNGGAVVDQRVIATSVAERKLADALRRPIWVANISAGGWAPEHQKAYLERFGWFDADVAVFVLSTHDLHQRAAFHPDMGPNFPAQAPPLALFEAVERYLPRYVPFVAQFLPVPEEGIARPGVDDPKAAEAILTDLLAEARSKTKQVVVLHHRTLEELSGDAPPDEIKDGERLREIALAGGAAYLDLGPVERNPPGGETLYRDGIHLTAAGQAVLEGALTSGVIGVLAELAAGQPDSCRAAPAL